MGHVDPMVENVLKCKQVVDAGLNHPIVENMEVHASNSVRGKEDVEVQVPFLSTPPVGINSQEVKTSNNFDILSDKENLPPKRER